METTCERRVKEVKKHVNEMWSHSVTHPLWHKGIVCRSATTPTCDGELYNLWSTHAGIGPGEHVSVHIDHRSNIDVKVLQHLLQLLIGRIRVHDLNKGSPVRTYTHRGKHVYHVTVMRAHTSLTNHWQKAGAIHSRAWIPQSTQITFFSLPSGFSSPNWSHTTF